MGRKPLRVLIAEDDTLVALLTEQELLGAGIEVVGRACDGQEAVELTCTLRPDAVLMDVQMPRMNGIEATREIRRCCPTPVVLLTAYSRVEAAVMAEEAGASGYLTKPARGEDLREALGGAVDGFRPPDTAGDEAA